MQAITLPINMLKAALISAGKKDARYYLNGICVDGRTLVATDGSRLFAAKIPDDELVPDVIIPRDAVERALKIADKRQVVIGLSHDPVAKTWVLGGLTFEPIDGKYPDWRRLIPKVLENNGATATLQMWPEFSVDAYKAHKLMMGDSAEPFWQTGDRFFLCGTTWLQIIYPMRMGKLSPLPDIG